MRRARDYAENDNNGFGWWSAKDVILYWAPGSDKVEVHPRGDAPWDDRQNGGQTTYYTGLGAFGMFQDCSDLETKVCIFRDLYTVIVRDKCDPFAVHQAMLSVKEYRECIPEDMFNISPPDRPYVTQPPLIIRPIKFDLTPLRQHRPNEGLKQWLKTNKH